MKYPFKVFQTSVEEHAFWVAECPTLKGCVGQGETLEEALSELEINEQIWLETAKEVGIPIPEVPVEPMETYSGKVTLRMAPYVHQEAAEMAKRSGVSLNQYINDAVVSHNSKIKTINYAKLEVKNRLADLREMMPQYSVTNSKSEDISSYNMSYSKAGHTNTGFLRKAPTLN